MAQHSVGEEQFPIRRQAVTEKYREIATLLVPQVLGRSYPHLAEAFLIKELGPEGSYAGVHNHGGELVVLVALSHTAGDWFTAIDVKDTFTLIYRFCRFTFQGMIYEYLVLLFGLSLNPRICQMH